MPIDITSVGYAAYALIFYAAMVVYAFVAYRSFEMAKAFVNRAFRTRARWIAAMSLALLLTDISGHAPYVGDINIGVVGLGILSVFLVIVVLAPFVDSTILVALDMDFFHRNTLHWRRTRIVVYIFLYGIIATALLLLSLVSLPSHPDWADSFLNSLLFNVLFAGIIGGTLSYAALTIVVASRRTYDIILQRHLVRLGLVFAFGTIAVLNDFTFGSPLVDGVLGGVVPSLWYFAAMSLTPLGRKEWDAATFRVTESAGPAPGPAPDPAQLFS